MTLQPERNPCNLRSWSSLPRRIEPFCWPGRLQRAYEVCALASLPATCSGGAFRHAYRMTVIAPMIRSRRMSRCPIFDVRPSTCFPPLECCFGTKPSQAAKSRPLLKVTMVGAKASTAIAVIRPHSGHGHKAGGALRTLRFRSERLFQRRDPRREHPLSAPDTVERSQQR